MRNSVLRNCAILSIVWLVVGVSDAWAQRVDYTGHKLVRVAVHTDADLKLLRSISPDLQTDYPGPGQIIPARIPPDRMDDLRNSGLRFEVLRENYQEYIDAQMVSAGRGTWDAYMDLDTIIAFINGLAAARPDLCDVSSIGTSLEGRDLWMLHITGAGGGTKPAVFYHSLIHCREWITGPVVLYLADHLVSNYDTDPDIQALVDTLDIYLLPVANPDGYVYTWGPERLWRKNRRDNGDGTIGVDLNRNWGYEWGYDDYGSSPYTSDPTYRGPSPFSEPETQVLRDFMIAHPEILAYMDYHSYSEEILWAWGYDYLGGPDEPDATTFNALGDAMQTLIQAVHGVSYEVGPIADTHSLVNGCTVDYAYGEHGFTALTTELRDTGYYGFELPPDQILPTCEENLPAILHLTQWAADQVGVNISFPNGRPTTLIVGTPEVIDVEVAALGDTLVPGSPTLHYRYDGGTFLTSALTFVSGDLYQATLPAAICSDAPEYYFSAEGSATGVEYAPTGAPTETYAALVGEFTAVFADDFETDQGWTAENLGASSGDWQRGVPVDDPGWDYDPATDSDGSGQCYLTQNETGNTDVDDGAVRLISPLLDLSGTDARVAYDYFLRLTDTDGTDRLLVEVNTTGGSGTWTEVTRHDTNGGLNWRHHEIMPADFAAAGVTPTASSQLRFTANDGDLQSIVEGGLDAFSVTVLVCEDNDTDGDNIPDGEDNCPNTYNPGQGDADGDEVGDACDDCPNDSNKTEPGICGCGVPDTDTDGDQTPDCNDNCPNEPALVDPSEQPEQTCADGIDNDCDGYTDVDDVDCLGAECTCGDLNDSGGTVDLSDFSVFQVCFGLRAPTAQCPQALFDCADLNQDDWINLTDFSTFQVLFGTVSTSSPPDCVD